MVVNELRGEKIDIVPFSEDLADFVAKALSPAKVSQVIITDDGTQADVIVPDHQLSLAIGTEGQNARLVGPPHRRARRHPLRDAARRGHPVGGRDAEVEYAEGEWVANAETGEMEWHAADGSVVSESAWQAQTEEPADDAVADEAGSTGDAADSTGDAAASTGDELLADAEVLTDSETDTASAVDEIAAQEGDDAGEAAAEPADAESTSEDDDA